jgi:hypothetical protein
MGWEVYRLERVHECKNASGSPGSVSHCGAAFVESVIRLGCSAISERGKVNFLCNDETL